MNQRTYKKKRSKMKKRKNRSEKNKRKKMKKRSQCVSGGLHGFVKATSCLTTACDGELVSRLAKLVSRHL
jgi:hypothetical protein